MTVSGSKPGGSISGETADAAEVLAFLRKSRGDKRGAEDYFDRFYYLYVLVLGLGAAVLYADQLLGVQVLGLLETPALLEQLRSWAPAALLLAFGAALRFCLVQGPVIFPAADIEFLLCAPISRTYLIRRRLIRGLSMGALAGAACGLLLFAALRGGLDSGSVAVTAPLLASCLAGCSALGLLAAALGWHVERSKRLARPILRYGGLMFPLAGVLALLSLIIGPKTGGTIALLSGPWGWAAAPAIAVAGGETLLLPVTGLLLAVATTLAVASAFATTGKIPLEELSRRARLRRGLSGNLIMMDHRGAALAGKNATRDLAGRGIGGLLGRPPRPRRAILAVPWRDLLWACRNPGNLAWAAVFASGTIFALQAAPSSGPVALGAILAAYFAAAQVVEPVRVEAETTEAARRLPYRYGELLLLHSVLPAVSLIVVGMLAATAGAAAGLITPGPLPLVAVLIVAGVFLSLLCAVAAAQRGPAPIELLAAGEQGALMLGVWLATGPLLSLAALGIPALFLIGGSGGGSVSLSAAVSALIVVLATLAVGVGVLGGRRFPG